MIAAVAPTQDRLTQVRIDASAVGLAMILVVTTALRLSLFRHAPLGFDETWTGDIASQPDLPHFLHQAVADVNGPLAYLIAWLWAPVSGLSDAALRVPSEVFTCLAPILPLVFGRELSRTTRLVWSALLACWAPDVVFAELARCYSLLIFLGVAESLAFIRLIRRPSLGAAMAWCAMSALFILAHYAALPLVAIQGCAFIAVHRVSALKTWPAALVFVPVFGFIALQARILAAFSTPGHAWIAPLNLPTLPILMAYLLGSFPILIGAAIWGAVGIVKASGKPAEPGGWRLDRGEILLAITGLAAVGLVVVLGFLRPMVTPRYLTPEVPAILFGVTLASRYFARGARIMPALVVALAFGYNLGMVVRPPFAMGDGSFEKASADLMASGVRRVDFFWDSPLTQGDDKVQFASVGGFFFRRAGYKAEVRVPAWSPDLDPNALLAGRASRPGDGFIWIYDNGVAAVRAVAHPPRVWRLNPALRCERYMSGAIHVLACVVPHPRAGRAPAPRLRPLTPASPR